MIIQLKIDGMHCAGCVDAARRALEAVPSVRVLSIDLAGRATVEASPETDGAKMLAAVEDAGYDARIEA